MDPKMRRHSTYSVRRRGSTKRPLFGDVQQTDDIPWDIYDRLICPIIICYLAAFHIAALFSILRIAHISTFLLFGILAICTAAILLFYHFLRINASGKSVLITGCEHPLAWNLAHQLDDMGFNVFAGFTNLEDQENAGWLKEESSARMKIIQLDVTSEAQILETSMFIAENLPEGSSGLWALINCANYLALGELEWVPTSVLRKSIDLNLFGTCRLTQIMLPLLRRSAGRILFLSSNRARLPEPLRLVHNMTLAATDEMASCLRAEVKDRNMNVVVVACGEQATGANWITEKMLLQQARDMWGQMNDEQRATYNEDYFEEKIRSMEKYTRSASFNLSNELRALKDAVTATFPMNRYTPVSYKEKFETLVATYLPLAVYDYMYSS